MEYKLVTGQTESEENAYFGENRQPVPPVPELLVGEENPPEVKSVYLNPWSRGALHDKIIDFKHCEICEDEEQPQAQFPSKYTPIEGDDELLEIIQLNQSHSSEEQKCCAEMHDFADLKWSCLVSVFVFELAQRRVY